MKRFVGFTILLALPYTKAKGETCIPLQHTIIGDDDLCMPYLNFGTGSSTSRRDDVADLTRTWLTPVGGVGVDTAFVYYDQDQVGLGLSTAGRDRETIFLTTKIPCDGSSSASKQTKENHEQLALPYFELVLVHNRAGCPKDSPRGLEMLNGTWNALVEDTGRAGSRALGVSNFDVQDLKDLHRLGSEVLPSVNQILMHVGCMPSQQLLDYCSSHGIVLESYSPLGKGSVLKHPKVQRLAAKYKRTAAQIALQYLIQYGFTIAFTTSKQKYMEENIAVTTTKRFVITAEDMTLLDRIKIPCRSQLDHLADLE